MPPESKNEENLEVNIVGAKNNVCSECRGLSVASSPETRAYVTGVTDRVSLPDTSSKIDSIHPFESDSFNETTKGNSYRALLDPEAAVTAISSQVWDKYHSHKNCCLDSSSTSCVTTVSGLVLLLVFFVRYGSILLLSLLLFDSVNAKLPTRDIK